MAQHNQADTALTSLDIDCDIPPELLTLQNVQSLSALEPCGAGCPKPVLMMKDLTVERLQPVGGGKHLRLRLRKGRSCFNAIYFSCGQEISCVTQGEQVDVAFVPQINEYREEKTVQMNLLDIRPACNASCEAKIGNYTALRKGESGAAIATALLPERGTLATVWRYLSATPACREMPVSLCRKIVRWSDQPLSLEKLLVCLDIFSDVGLMHVQRLQKHILIHLSDPQQKADLNESATMQLLLQMKE